MEKSDGKVGRLFLIFAAICIVSLPWVILSAFSFEPEQMDTKIIEPGGMDFDQNGKALFESYSQLPLNYLAAVSTERTLSEYYDRRQYPGSPPVIPHEVEANDPVPSACLACHEKGGWAQAFKRYTPLTPHPEYDACRQCHVPQNNVRLFVESDWRSVAPPVLGRSYLPGAPPPIPHEIRMRGNCMACHAGPGAVTALRVAHASRGNCRQCHVMPVQVEPFSRKF